MEKLQNNVKEKQWNQEAIALGILVKKFGKNGLLEFELKKEDFPNTLNITMTENKVTIYAE
jgi:hypothetical protein